MAWEDTAQPGVPDRIATVYEALFLDTAVTNTDTLRVAIPGFDSGEQAFEVDWMPRAGASGQVLPAAGDRAVVVEALSVDGDSTLWAVVCWTPA